MEAVAAWQWRNFWAARAPAGRTVAHINMDETSVRLDPVRSIRGAVALEGNETRRDAAFCVRSAPLGLRRAAFTLVAFIADTEEVQKLLPQVIVASRRLLPQRVAAQHIARADNIFMLSANSAWLSGTMLCRILRLVGAALRPVHEQFWLLLSMDVCPAHLSRGVALAARRAGLCLHYIPACMTSCLQPLDTHVFAQFKLRLSQAYHERLLESSTGTMRVDEFLTLACGVANAVFSHAWPEAFKQCGFCTAQSGVGRSVMRILAFTVVPHVPETLPTLAQLQNVWKRGCDIPIAELFAHAVPGSAPTARHRHATSPERSVSLSPPRPLRMRLRSAAQLPPVPCSSPSAPAESPAPTAAAAHQATPPCPHMEVPQQLLRRLPVGHRLLTRGSGRPPELPQPSA